MSDSGYQRDNPVIPFPTYNFCCLEFELTHLPVTKMAAIVADDIFKCIVLHENCRITIQISLKLVPRSPMDNKAAFVQVMA